MDRTADSWEDPGNKGIGTGERLWPWAVFALAVTTCTALTLSTGSQFPGIVMGYVVWAVPCYAIAWRRWGGRNRKGEGIHVMTIVVLAVATWPLALVISRIIN